MEAIRRAGTELVNGAISQETMDAISDVPISTEDYRAMVNASFEGGITGAAKTAAIGFKVMRGKTARRKSASTK
jgi:hypothetical protein